MSRCRRGRYICYIYLQNIYPACIFDEKAQNTTEPRYYRGNEGEYESREERKGGIEKAERGDILKLCILMLCDYSAKSDSNTETFLTCDMQGLLSNHMHCVFLLWTVEERHTSNWAGGIYDQQYTATHHQRELKKFWLHFGALISSIFFTVCSVDNCLALFYYSIWPHSVRLRISQQVHYLLLHE